jgi:HK97 gp10 family phage protein
MAKGFEIKGISDLLNKLEDLSVDALQEIDAEMSATANRIATKAKQNAPVDVGNLRQTISVADKPFEKEIKVNANYAAYVEFGTGALVDVPQGLEDYAIQFKGKGVKQVNLPARPYVFPATKTETKDLEKRLKIIIESEGRK